LSSVRWLGNPYSRTKVAALEFRDAYAFIRITKMPCICLASSGYVRPAGTIEELMKIAEVYCKNALSRSKISGKDYALNPYTGCEHGCVYCYAEFMKKFTNHKEEWGEFVDVKINIVDRLRQQIKRTKPGTIMIGTVTDAYQPLEEKYRLTRRCLEILADFDFPITILTKSDLVIRDVDILKGLRNKNVGFTITCIDPKIEALFEPKASKLENRFKALENLGENDIPTFVFFGPILPFFSDSEASIQSLLERLKKMGIEKICFDKMNYLNVKWGKFKTLLKRNFPEALSYYQRVAEDGELYSARLRALLDHNLSDSCSNYDIVF
jgi:DNA repair photolyase